MKRKLLACTALVLCLVLLCGCTSIATSEWIEELCDLVREMEKSK